ncbi:hypothetical protein [Spiroplasma culicicola]|uniref:Uncharacterized protein n=1 Tax=Spiroplasma culicicola AES-1 TaxID=1276246 RepID=W6A6U6_9MOLU|nr:hypothetical protein [Spiroplasma culicicola]AHI52848.1 hypothetical protein SCULI_v1c05070 [Spiroplasma culicicola AES-1]
MTKCELNNCGKEVNALDPKRIYIFDETIEDEVPVAVCDDCYKKEKDQDNNIDWDHSVEETEK